MRRVNEKGFTIVEVAVTLFVASVLVAGIIRLQTSVSRLSIQQVQHRIASDIAYNNLRKYVNENPPTWFACEVVGGVAKPKTLFDKTATAPYLCGGGTSGIGMPIRVESTVTYGPDHRKVTHASYAAF